MTPGEQAVWAGELLARQASGCTWDSSICWAARAVEAVRLCYRNAERGSTRIDPPALRMLAEIVGPARAPLRIYTPSSNGTCQVCGLLKERHGPYLADCPPEAR